MRCNPARWLWGLIPIAMLSWIAYVWERPAIEADLGRRAQERLARQGLGWAFTEFSGRDAIVRGRASEEGEPRKALETVRELWGVRIVEGRTDLLPKVDVFSWAARSAKDSLALSGYVPNEAARKSLLAVARANFPKRRIEDAMKVARGAPRQDVWVSGASFALRQLAQMRRGNAELTGVTLGIAGEALDTASYKAIRTSLNQLPGGIKLGSEAVTPAVVSPFVWTAARAPEKLVLSGHVPSDGDREQIFALAKKLFKGTAIVDRLEIAGGAPDGWANAVAVSLEQLALLKNGSAETRDTDLTIAGEAESETAAESIRLTLRSAVPGTMRWSERINFPEPPPPPVEPEPAPAAEATPPDYDPDAAYAALKAKREAEWLEYEARWSAAAEAEATRKAEEESARLAALEAAEAEAKRKAEEEALERRREEEAEARRKADEARAKEQAERAAAVAPEAQAKTVAANRCQELMRDAVQKGQILFKTDSAELDTRSRPTLDALSKIAAACPGARIEIAGHTDSDGSDDSNLQLSVRRAQSVLAYLASAGVDAGRLKGFGYGETRPIVPNTSASNKSKNRRIEFTVLPN